MPLQVAMAVGALASVVNEVVAGIETAVPSVLLGVVFLVVAYAGIRLGLAAVRAVLHGTVPADQELVVDFLVVLVGAFLWFGAILTLLQVVGLGEIAASLGTAAGFVGLGIAYALDSVIADTVSGVYLVRDDDIQVGDRVETADTTGIVTAIDLRKTRLRTADGDLHVLPNSDVEKRWTQKTDGDRDPAA